MKEAKKTNIKKIILAAVIIAVIAVLVIFIYNKFVSKSIYSGDGIYYSQMNKGYFLQFNRDNSFKLAYSPKDDPTAEKSELNDNVEIYIEHSGTWEEKGDEIILKYTDGSGDDGFTLKKDKDIIYNPELIFKGKVYNEDVFQGTYETENKDGKYDSIVFFDDGNVTYDTHWGKTVRNRQGYYKRNGNIITIRYNNDADTEHKFLVTADGIVEDIYMTN